MSPSQNNFDFEHVSLINDDSADESTCEEKVIIVDLQASYQVFRDFFAFFLSIT
jgi:hypothetical protein